MTIFQSENISYWLELRQRLLYCIYCITVVFIICYHFANDIYHIIALPVLSNISGKKLIVLSLTDSIMTPLKLSWYFSLILSMPFLFYQLWKFIAPALYKQERLVFIILLSASSILFYCGVGFSIGVIMPFLIQYLMKLIPQDVYYLPDMRLYFEFITTMSVSFGLAFELPLIMFLINKIGWVSYQQLSLFRRYFIILAFFIGMILTPPDVISQSLLAIPICILYEFGMLIIKVFTYSQNDNSSVYTNKN